MYAKTLSRDLIVDAATELIERDGIDALTMRALAERLDTSPMSLYRHVETKQELLRAVADRYLSEVELPPTDDLDWKETITRVSVAVHEAFIEHPVLTEILPEQHIDAITMFRATDAILTALSEAGVEGRDAVQWLDVITCYATGFTQRKAELRSRTTAQVVRLQRLRELPEDEFATTRALAGEIVGLDFEHRFEDGLQLILDGVEARVSSRG